jgi:soluble lytic murein transglycosylase-like protein
MMRDDHEGKPARRLAARWLALLAMLAAGPAPAGEPSFEELTRSEEPNVLLEWGKRHFYGVKATQSIDKAIQLYCGAARLGSGEAQFRLGEIYAGSAAGKKDEVLAASWLLKATLSSYGSAKSKLAQWDLTDAELSPEPDCAVSGQMVARSLPRARPAAADTVTAAAAKPEVAPKIVGSPKRRDIERLVRELAPGYRLNPELVLAVIEVESNFNPKARSPKSAQGLMQLIPATARRFGVSDPWDPHQNLKGGMAYLRWLLDHFQGDLKLALAGYNAGEKAVQRHGGVPPYTETRNYVKKVARVLGVSEDRLSSVDSGSRAKAVFTRPGEERGKGSFESRFFDLSGSG